MPNDKNQPEYPIDLGRTMKDMGAMPADMTTKEMENEVHYPSLHLEWEEPYNFPDEGTMTVKFKKTSEENRKNKSGTMQVVNLDILEILDTEAKSVEEAEGESTSDVLDKEMKKVVNKKKKESAPKKDAVEEPY